MTLFVKKLLNVLYLFNEYKEYTTINSNIAI